MHEALREGRERLRGPRLRATRDRASAFRHEPIAALNRLFVKCEVKK